ncbi:MAG: ABC-2 family transporter protein [Pseudomonadales bacterium]|nr:ABC-2 family transporter protein [Pseudomonadales bacterium]
MIAALQLYGHMMVMSVKGQMQYRLSFFFLTLASFVTTIIELVGIWALFDRFGSLGQWQLYHVCFFFGIVNAGFAVSDALTTGFDQMGTLYIKNGQFDRLLLRPRSIALQLFGHELALRRAGRLLQAVLVLIWSGFQLQGSFHPLAPLILLFAVTGVICLFVGLFILQATLSFWTVESLEVMNTVTYGGVETAQYPLAIYNRALQWFFIWIVPLGCVAYFPVVAALNLTDPLGTPWLFQALAPSAGVIFLALSLLIFNRAGIRHYTSTGS